MEFVAPSSVPLKLVLSTPGCMPPPRQLTAVPKTGLDTGALALDGESNQESSSAAKSGGFRGTSAEKGQGYKEGKQRGSIFGIFASVRLLYSFY